nr:hypothetical protein [Tanacetum cinerariifolium]
QYKLDSKNETDESESGSESDHEEKEEDEDDEEEVKDEFIKTPSNDSDDKAEGDEDEEMDYTTSQLYDDVDIRLNEPVDTDKGYSHIDAEIVSPIDLDIHHEMVKESLEDIILSKESSQLQSSYEAATTLIKFELKKILIDKMDRNQGLKKRKTGKDAKPAKGPKAKESQFGSSKATSLNQNLLEILFSQRNKSLRLWSQICHKIKRGTWVIMMKNPKKMLHLNVIGSPNLHNLKSLLILIGMLTFDELMSTPIDFSAFIMNGLNINNISQETLLGPAFRLLKGIRSNYIELEYDFKECYKALLEKLDWENQEGVTQVKVTRKHGYGYLQAIVVRRVNNDLYIFKEGDFPRLHVNDIEDMLLLVVRNRLTNVFRDDVSDFAIALRMFTRSLVIQKRVEDHQIRVKSYPKKINVTKPESTKSEIRKREPYTPYQDPQGFIYFNDSRRNRLMRSDELYKFSDDTLTRLQTSLGDITKNIRMEYLQKKRWST